MSVNYLIEIIRLDEWEFRHPISATAYKLMRKIYHTANLERFPEWIEIPNAKLTAMVGCTESTLAAARLTLIQKGLIEYKKKGKGKGATCWYKINYFSHNPAYYSKNYGINAGENNSENEGKSAGNNEGKSAGQYININKAKPNETMVEDDEEDYANVNNDYIPAEGQTIVKSPLLHPTPPEGLVGVQSRAGAEERTPIQRMMDEQQMLEAYKRRGRRMVYAPRTKPLGPAMQREYERIKSHLAFPDIRHLYGDGMQVLRQIVESDYYPLMLVDYAIEKTIDRNRMFPAGLDTPIAYTIKLLDDWKRQGFNLPADVRRAKDDYSDSY